MPPKVIKSSIVNLSLSEESMEATMQEQEHREQDALIPRFEPGKRKKIKQARDVSPASRYFRKPIVADQRHVQMPPDKDDKGILMPINKII